MYHDLSFVAASFFVCAPLFFGITNFVPWLIGFCFTRDRLPGQIARQSTRQRCAGFMHFCTPAFLSVPFSAALAIFYFICRIYECPDGFIAVCSALFLILFLLMAAVIAWLKNSAGLLQSYTDRLENAYNGLRADRHDYRNVLLSIYSFLQDKDYESLDRYFISQVYPAAAHAALPDALIAQLSNIKCRELKSILYVKLNAACGKALSISVLVPGTVDTLFMESVDLVRITGILLDNAIEAAADSDEKLLTVCVVPGSSCLSITISNSCREDIPDLSALFDLGVSTKASCRGVGLYSLKSLLNKHKNTSLTTHCSNHVFTQNLQIICNTSC